ncbi:uncharacterized protein F4817DRAFT_20769 [Daldinia loculata]|uniref:uncharacterized protein n=1 Tax=Daldinia loculata TaxID=103429 RepID=UPI0020C4EECC|nr:uncharacterized protein F4817DRAFT_20769 [Daldinia loculata]KAI1641974.1 hypothetical protein F4817DRAFT_20769 [Daldinia loculata]
MLFRKSFALPTPVMECRAGVRFTTHTWDFEYGKTLILTWIGTVDLVNIDLAKFTTEGLMWTGEVAKRYEGNNTFMLTPGIDLTPGDYVFYISDGWCTDESPKLSLPGGFLQNNTPRDISGKNSTVNQGDDGLASSATTGISIGSTLGGIFLLLALVAFLIHRGRRIRTKLEDPEANTQNKGKQKQKEPQISTQGTL